MKNCMNFLKFEQNRKLNKFEIQEKFEINKFEI
jgi:hypothetical protein